MKLLFLFLCILSASGILMSQVKFKTKLGVFRPNLPICRPGLRCYGLCSQKISCNGCPPIRCIVPCKVGVNCLLRIKVDPRPNLPRCSLQLRCYGLCSQARTCNGCPPARCVVPCKSGVNCLGPMAPFINIDPQPNLPRCSLQLRCYGLCSQAKTCNGCPPARCVVPCKSGVNCLGPMPSFIKGALCIIEPKCYRRCHGKVKCFEKCFIGTRCIKKNECIQGINCFPDTCDYKLNCYKPCPGPCRMECVRGRPCSEKCQRELKRCPTKCIRGIHCGIIPGLGHLEAIRKPTPFRELPLCSLHLKCYGRCRGGRLCETKCIRGIDCRQTPRSTKLPLPPRTTRINPLPPRTTRINPPSPRTRTNLPPRITRINPQPPRTTRINPPSPKTILPKKTTLLPIEIQKTATPEKSLPLCHPNLVCPSQCNSTTDKECRKNCLPGTDCRAEPRCKAGINCIPPCSDDLVCYKTCPGRCEGLCVLGKPCPLECFEEIQKCETTCIPGVHCTEMKCAEKGIGELASDEIDDAKLDITDCWLPPRAMTYSGTVNKTISGHTCQQWQDNYPHIPNKHARNHCNFPERNYYEAKNYCRNPDNECGSPWCYTTNPAVRWEFCDVPKCAKDLYPKEDLH